VCLLPHVSQCSSARCQAANFVCKAQLPALQQQEANPFLSETCYRTAALHNAAQQHQAPTANRLLSASPVGEARCRCRQVWLTRTTYDFYSPQLLSQVTGPQCSNPLMVLLCLQRECSEPQQTCNSTANTNTAHDQQSPDGFIPAAGSMFQYAVRSVCYLLCHLVS
jgi:hypothetical protein